MYRQTVDLMTLIAFSFNAGNHSQLTKSNLQLIELQTVKPQTLGKANITTVFLR